VRASAVRAKASCAWSSARRVSRRARLSSRARRSIGRMVGLGAQRPVGAGGAILLVMRSVYVETSVASYYAETRDSVKALAWREATRVWWEKAAERYRLVTS